MSYEARRTRSTLAMPRSRGLIIGLCLVILGIWGAIIPFVGPYFHYAYVNLQRWHFTYGRLWLSILPGAATFFGGLLLLIAGNRVMAVFGGWLAAIGGIWFVIGSEVSRLWNHGLVQAGLPYGGHTRQVLEQLGYFYLLGAAIIFLAAFAIGRASVAAARDVLIAERGGRRFGRRRFGRRRAAPAAPAGAAGGEQPTRSVGQREPVSYPDNGPQRPPAEGRRTGGRQPA